MAEEAEGNLPFVGYVGSFSEVCETVFQVLSLGCGHELQLGSATAGPGGDNQAAGRVLFQDAALVRQDTGQGLLADQEQAVGRGGVPPGS